MSDAAAIAKRFVALSFCRADMLFEVDSNQNILFSAGTTNELLGKSSASLAGQPFDCLLDEADGQMFNDLLLGASKDGRFDEIDVRLPLKSGATCDAVISGYRVADFHDNFFLALKVRPKRSEPAHRRLVDRDPDSGMLNEKAFSNAASKRIQAISASGGDAKMTMVKIGNLETARKGMSEEAHKQMVGAIGGILNTHSAGGNTAGRIDDEHFGIVHGGDVDIDSVNSQIEAAAKDMAPENIAIRSTSQTVSADGAGLSEDQIAKAISYTIKAYTENKNVSANADLNSIFETMMTDTMRQVDAFRQICSTLDFDLNFMPICDLKSGAVHHLEALTRFRGKIGASGSPYQLITLAEEVGVISDFDLAVAYKAVETVKANAAEGGLPPLAVNVSGHSISSDEFVEELLVMLESEIDLSQSISLEITESAEITDFDRVNEHIQAFRQRKFTVALDDFGAGAASFDYLNNFDVDAVKFDGPVVKRAYQTEKGKAFLASMATLCKTMKVETIAEMVEDAELARFLRDCGIDLGQGYHFGKPGPDPRAFTKKSNK